MVVYRCTCKENPTGVGALVMGPIVGASAVGSEIVGAEAGERVGAELGTLVAGP